LRLIKKTEAITKIQAIIIACIIVAVGVSLGWYYLIPKRTSPEYILIGAPIPFTGVQGATGPPTEWIYSKAIEDYNKDGGVYVKEYGKKIPLKLIVADSKSSADAGAEAAAKLILQDKVNLLVTSQPPPLAFPIASIAEKYKVPIVMHAGPVEAFIQAGPWKYAWEHSFRNEQTIKLFAELSAKFAEKTTKKVALAVVGDVDGTTWYERMVPKAKEIGLTPLELGPFPPGTSDFTVLIQEWKAQNAEIFWANCMTDQFATLWRQCVQQGYRPKLALVGRALLNVPSVEAVGGNLANGVVTDVFWHPDYPWGTPPFPGGRAIVDMYEKERNLPWTMTLGAGYGHIQIIVDAITRAGTLDSEKVNEAIGQSTIVTPLGPVHFDTETHGSASPAVLAQWLKTEKGWDMEIVYSDTPEIRPTMDLVFPLPPL
jgi:branched-chain amino acid transport system substrate-binding protein